MTRALLCALMIVAVVGSPIAQPARAQTNEPGLDAEPPDRVRTNKHNKTRGDAAASKLSQSRTDKLFQDFSKAMQWELKTSRDQTDQITQIMKQFREDAEGSAAPKKQNGQKQLTEAEEKEAARILEIEDGAKRAIMRGDRERARELIKQLPRRERGFQDTAEELDPRMFYAIDAVLAEPIRTQFWQIVTRFVGKSRTNPGALYLNLLKGFELSREQGAAISLHYKVFMEEMRTVKQDARRLRSEDDRDALNAVQGTFRRGLLAELSEEQQQAFHRALKQFDRHDKRHKRGSEGNTRW